MVPQKVPFMKAFSATRKEIAEFNSEIENILTENKISLIHSLQYNVPHDL